MMRSAQESFRPYLRLIGQSNRRALSRLALSGQLLSGAKRWAPLPPPPRPSAMRYVPAAWQPIRLDRGECWWRTERSGWFGHQSRFVIGRCGLGVGDGITGFSLSLTL